MFSRPARNAESEIAYFRHTDDLLAPWLRQTSALHDGSKPRGHPVSGRELAVLIGVIQVDTIEFLFLPIGVRKKVKNGGPLRQIKHKGNDDDYQEEDEDKFPLLGDEVLQSGNHDKS